MSATTNCITPGLFDHTAYLSGGVSPHAIHIEALPGGFLVGVSGGHSSYTRQVITTAEALADFVRAWAVPK